MIAVSYLLGIGFAGAAIFKFKQHKDNPTQIPIGTPIALLVIGILLIFLPGIIGPIGTTIFGSSGTQISGGPQGSAAALPGTSSK
jgi:intracellular multiplication protein IcmD